MRTLAATTAVLLLAPLNLLYVLAGLMLAVEILNGPQRLITATLLLATLIAYLPVFALNSLARRYVVGGPAKVAAIHPFWWVCAFTFLVPVLLAAVYALYRLLGGQPHIPACASEDCPFGPGTSDGLLLGFVAVPFAVPVLHLWTLSSRYMRSNKSLERTRDG